MYMHPFVEAEENSLLVRDYLRAVGKAGPALNADGVHFGVVSDMS